MQLLADDGPRPLQGLMLNQSPDVSAVTAPASHLVVLGRYALADGSPAASSRLKLRFTLFGQGAQAQQQTVTVTHRSDAQKIVLAPGRARVACSRRCGPCCWTTWPWAPGMCSPACWRALVARPERHPLSPWRQARRVAAGATAALGWADGERMSGHAVVGQTVSARPEPATHAPHEHRVRP